MNFTNYYLLGTLASGRSKTVRFRSNAQCLYEVSALLPASRVQYAILIPPFYA